MGVGARIDLCQTRPIGGPGTQHAVMHQPTQVRAIQYGSPLSWWHLNIFDDSFWYFLKHRRCVL